MTESTTENEETTWVAKIPEEEFYDHFEVVPGNSRLYKLDLEKIFPFQKHILLLKFSHMKDGRSIIREVAKEKGYFDLGLISEGLGTTVKIIDKEDNSLNLYPGDGDYFSISKTILRSLTRHLTATLEDPETVNGHLVYEVDGSKYRSIPLTCWDLDDIHVISDKEGSEKLSSMLDSMSSLNELAGAAKTLNKGFVLINRKKNNMAFLLHTERGKGIIDLTYLESIDIYAELKRLSNS